jgi:pyruvate,orthophosphate dikinase
VDLVLQVLNVKGRATPEALAVAVGADAAATAEAVAGFAAAGLVEPTKLGYKLTEPGCRRVDELYAVERSQAGTVVEDVYRAFGPINDEVKQIVTDWQMRTVGGELTLNDHSDPHHDQRVIARLRTADAKVSTALAPLTAALPRFAAYPDRLGRAVAEVCAGDHTMLAAPLKDSYHTVWFELHEELLALADRPRSAEPA